ncbi:MAG: hypothetical protein Q7J47_22090 [Azoarcus sp.]|nr:hypothetical protein [Azoarcus sp.]
MNGAKADTCQASSVGLARPPNSATEFGHFTLQHKPGATQA